MDKHENHNPREHIAQIRLEPVRKPNAFSLIRLAQKVLPIRAPVLAALMEKNQRTDRQKVVADNEVFKIKNAAPLAQGFNMGKFVETKRAWKRKDEKQNAVEPDGGFPRPSPHVDKIGNDILKNGDHC